MDFKNIEKKYCSAVFWLWNEKLNTNETIRRIEEMDKAALGGYMIYPWDGLETRYMGDEWFRNICAAAIESAKRGMQMWVCDETASKEGFAGSAVSSMGLSYQQKFLRIEAGEKTNERTITYKDGYHFYYDVNPFYVDLLDAKVTEQLIEKTYEPYYNKCGGGACSFITSLPYYDGSDGNIPWSFELPAEYKNEYGEELLDRLIELFRPVGQYEDTRLKFWRLVTKLFSRNYTKQIYDWCRSRKIGFSGRLTAESFIGQTGAYGAAMAHYEFFDAPAVNCCIDEDENMLTNLQAVSVAHQTGRKEVLAPCFENFSNNIGFDDMMKEACRLMVQGATKICPQFYPYSLRGERKHGCTPVISCQQPWWNKYHTFNEALARMGKIFSEGEFVCDTLLLHNMTSVWMCYDGGENMGADEYKNALIEDCKLLMEKHIPFHLGDETVMERHAYVEGDVPVIGKQRYRTVVVPKNIGFFQNTQKLLSEFEHGGGTIITAEDIAFNDICSSPYIIYAKRDFDGFCIHCFVNNSDENVSASFKRGSRVLDIMSGEEREFYGSYDFAPGECLMLIDDGTPFLKKGFEMQSKPLELGGMWNIVASSSNVLRLDKCEIYLNGEAAGTFESVLDAAHITLGNGEAHMKLEFPFAVNFLPEESFLVCENRQSLDITVNGKELAAEDEGYFSDAAFRKYPLSDMLHIGENVISIEADFSAADKKFSPEPLYIIGDFSVKMENRFEELPGRMTFNKGAFVIDKPSARVWLSNLEEQGFPFFCGTLTLEKSFELTESNYAVMFSKKGINAVSVRVNGEAAADMLCSPFVCDISSMLKEGTNTVELTLINNLENMLAPFGSKNIDSDESGYLFTQFGIEM